MSDEVAVTTPATQPAPAASTTQRSELWHSMLTAGMHLLTASMRGDRGAWAALQRAHAVLVTAARERGAR